MPAIISDQFRILNAANFVAGVADTSQYYYSFIGLPNSQDIGAGYGQTDWNTNTPAPMDGFKEYNDAWDTMLGLKQLIVMMFKEWLRKPLGQLVQYMKCIRMDILERIRALKHLLQIYMMHNITL